jgi:hypothetical protein
MGVLRNLLFALVLLLGAPTLALSADIYINQAGTVPDTGLDSCDNAHSAAWFNANATGGNTYHLCGTFTGAANSTMFTIPKSGTVGNILAVLFEPNAVLSSPQWNANGAIYINGKDYVTIDGGTNGLITNTANGTSKTYHTSSSGITASGSYITIENLTITNIYLNEGSLPTATDAKGALTWGISVNSNGSGNITIENNYMGQSRGGLSFGFSSSGGTNIDINNNTTVNHSWGMYITANSDSNVMISNFNVHGNDISDWSDWGYPAWQYHQDGIFISGKGIASIDPINVYGNKIHGNLAGGSVTASLYCTFDGTTYPGPRVNVYNNLFISDNNGNMTGPAFAGGNTYNVYNNTIVLKADKTGYGILGGNPGTIINLLNNIIVNAAQGVASPSNANYTLGTVDYNLWYNVARWSDAEGKVYRNTIADWQAAGHDAHGYYADPIFVSTTDYHLQATSPARGKATSSISPLTFTNDYAGAARPQGAAWDIGAYEYRTVPNMSNFGTGAITITPNNSGAITITPY